MRSRTLPKRFPAAGFTLVEVLISLSMTAMVAVIAYTGLSAAISAVESNEARIQELEDVQIAWSVIARDVRQAVPRPIVDEYGDEQPALSGGATEDYPLRFTRSGWANPGEWRRSELQRIRYVWRDLQLWRQSWVVLDRIAEGEPQEVLLLDEVDDFKIRFLNTDVEGFADRPFGGEWEDSWPLEDGDRLLPEAVELTITLEDWGEVRRVFQIDFSLPRP